MTSTHEPSPRRRTSPSGRRRERRRPPPPRSRASAAARGRRWPHGGALTTPAPSGLRGGDTDELFGAARGFRRSMGDQSSGLQGRWAPPSRTGGGSRLQRRTSAPWAHPGEFHDRATLRGQDRPDHLVLDGPQAPTSPGDRGTQPSGVIRLQSDRVNAGVSRPHRRGGPARTTRLDQAGCGGPRQGLWREFYTAASGPPSRMSLPTDDTAQKGTRWR